MIVPFWVLGPVALGAIIGCLAAIACLRMWRRQSDMQLAIEAQTAKHAELVSRHDALSQREEQLRRVEMARQATRPAPDNRQHEMGLVTIIEQIVSTNLAKERAALVKAMQTDLARSIVTNLRHYG